jgi:hypothetical protein
MGKDKKGLSKLMFALSAATLVVAGVVSVFKVDIWLAGTQWILVSIVLAVYAVYLSLNGCCGEEKEIN